jgi:cystathionine beta-lyase
MPILHGRSQEYVYGRRGTPTSRSVESAIALLEGGYAAKVCPSGMAAISTVLLAYLKAGDHLLMTDTVYLPGRHFCDTVLKGLGVETAYYDPAIGAGIAALIRPNTRVVYCESPGSLTMEMQDIPAIAAAAHKHGCTVVADNTWAAGHYFKAFEHGCDVSLQAATKYLVGHSDAMMGSVACGEAAWPRFKDAYEAMGQFAGPDDMYLTLRGIRTLDVRLERHMKNAVAVAEWLRGRAEVETVLYPALSNAPAMKLKRDFTGAPTVLIILKPCPGGRQAFVNSLNLSAWAGAAESSAFLRADPHRHPMGRAGPLLPAPHRSRKSPRPDRGSVARLRPAQRRGLNRPVPTPCETRRQNRSRT